jgi:Zn-dependent protease with chaperone function
VAVYTGIFPIARDEAGLAVILGHEVAHALLRHSGERMTQTQILGTGFSLAGAGGVNPQILQALGLGASVVEQQNGERAVAEALAYKLRLNLLTIVNERQQLKVGYGQYAALRVLRIWVGDPLGISWPSINGAAPGRLSLKITPVDSMN